MPTIDEYNMSQLTARRFTLADIAELLREWQRNHVDADGRKLKVDGLAGPKTLASIAEALRSAPFLSLPMPKLADGRLPTITSRFKANNPDRPDHDGVDILYAWRPGDKPDRVGDGGAAGRKADGTPKWGVPFGTLAIAAAPGTVVEAGDTKTGHRCWIDHGRGLRSGYFHMTDLRVVEGQRVDVGHPLGLIGDNPNDKGDPRHLHFELSPTGRYDPMDPEPYLIR